jgi:hypothetical protein
VKVNEVRQRFPMVVDPVVVTLAWTTYDAMIQHIAELESLVLEKEKGELDTIGAYLLDAARYRWLRGRLHSAAAGGGVEVNMARQWYEAPEEGKEVRVYWYPMTPVGFHESEAATLDEAIDRAMSGEWGAA